MLIISSKDLEKLNEIIWHEIPSDELVDLLATARPEAINRIAHKALSKALYFSYPE